MSIILEAFGELYNCILDDTNPRDLMAVRKLRRYIYT